jgi:hypothetical protein
VPSYSSVFLCITHFSYSLLCKHGSSVILYGLCKKILQSLVWLQNCEY